MFNHPYDILKSIMDMLLPKELLNFMVLNKEYNELKRIYNYPHMIYISGSIRNFIKSFPNFNNINISRRSRLKDDDFQLCNNIQKIKMKLCNMSLTTDNMFSHFTNLKKLILLDYSKKNDFSDKIFDYLTNLEKLSINYNNKITDQGLQKLVNIKNLFIRLCPNISGHGLSNLTGLIKLHIYHIKNVFNHHFKNLINLKELELSFIHEITSECIIQLPKLQNLKCIGCRGIASCDNFDKLKDLKLVSFYNCPVNDSDFKYLKNIKKLYIIHCPFILGGGFKYLLNIEVLSIYENSLDDCFLSDLISLKNIRILQIRNYRNSNESTSKYDSISKERKTQLKEIFGNKFISN